jgi:hypothetical protein
MDTSSVQRDQRARIRLHAVLKESIERYKNELLDEEERLVLADRIVKLNKRLAATLPS